MTQELSARTGHRIGSLLHIHAGQAFEMNDEEAANRIAAGDVLVASKPDEKEAALISAADAAVKGREPEKPAPAKTEKPEKADK